MAAWEGQILDAVVAYVQANEPVVLAAIASENGNVTNFVENAAITLTAKIPIIGGTIGAALKGAGPSLVAFLGSEEQAGLTALVALLQAEAKALGG
jgi:hypothetical protein